MALPTPNLDDRKFQDIVREARTKIPLYCPKWTDYNLSDPGITLIELFAWMTDMLLYRMNRVPEKNYIKFMGLLGVKLETAKPAKVDITFRLSAPQLHTITIPLGTEIATLRTETLEAISFTTDEDLHIIVPDLVSIMTTLDNAIFTNCTKDLKKLERPVTVFKAVPEENNAMYFGFSQSLAGQTLRLNIDSNIEGIGVDPKDPPLAWECWDGIREKWIALKIEDDSTGGLNTNGSVILYIPYSGEMSELNELKAFWVRCRATKPHLGQRPYVSSPRVKMVSVECIGGTVKASHCLRIKQEMLGRSNAAPGQIFNLHSTPILSRFPHETVEVETEKEGEYETWQEVPDFSASGPEDKHFTLDSVSGEIQFGPLIRQASGEERQYGKIPALSRQIRFTGYRWGGGVIGNVGKGTIVVLRSSIPYVDSVINFSAASGGRDAETMEAAKMRAPQIVRNQTRAVTATDFEYLAVEASSLVARAKCLAAGTSSDNQTIPPGVVRVLLVPKVEDLEGPIPKDQLELLSNLRTAVHQYLDERRLLAMRVEIAAPEYQPVAVEASVKVKSGIDPDRVAESVRQRLYQFINPVCGGPNGNGWPFGRGLFPSDIFSVVQNTPYVDYIDSIKIFSVDWESGQRQEVNTKISIPVNGLVCSVEHKVAATVIDED